MELVAHRALGVPETYRAAFVRVAQDGVLTPAQATTLSGWAGLRNVLAHLYTSIDLDRLHAAVLEDKTTLRELAAIAARELTGE